MLLVAQRSSVQVKSKNWKFKKLLDTRTCVLAINEYLEFLVVILLEFLSKKYEKLRYFVVEVSSNSPTLMEHFVNRCCATIVEYLTYFHNTTVHIDTDLQVMILEDLWAYKGALRGVLQVNRRLSIFWLLVGAFSWCWTVTLTLSWIAHCFHGWVHISISMWIRKYVNSESSGPFLLLKIRFLDYQSHVVALPCRRLCHLFSLHTTCLRLYWTLSS